MGSFRHCLLYGIIISVTSWNLSLCNPHMSFRSVTERQSPMEPANTANRKETWKRLITERGNHKLTALDVIKLLKAKNLLRDTSVTTTSPSVTNFDPTRLENRLFNHPMMAESAPPSDVQTSLTRDATSQVQSHAANPRSGFDRTVSGDHVQKAMSFQRADPKQVKSSLSQHQVRMSLSHSQISQAPNPTSNNQQQQNQQQEVPSNINPQQQLPSLWQQQQVFQGQEPSPKHHFQQFQQHRLRKPLQPSQHSNHHSRHAQWLEQQQNRNAQQQHHNEHQQHEQKQQQVNHNVHILQQHQFQQKQNQHQQHQPHENIPQMKHQGNQHTAHAPTQQMSQQSGQKFPQQSAQQFPQQPGQQFPQQSAQQFPQQPGQQFPQQPAQQFPQQPAQQFPQQPGQHETKTAGQQQMQHNHVTQQQQAEQLNHHNHQLFNPQQQSFEQQTQKKQDIINQQQVNNNLHQQHTTEGTMPQQHVSTGTVKREKIRLHPQVDSRFIGNAMAHSMRNHATPNLLQQQFQFTSGDQFQAQHFTHPQGSGPIIQQPINSQRTHNSPPSSISVNTVPPVKQTGKQGHVNPTKPAVNLQSPSPLPSPSLHAFVEQPVVAKPVQNEHGVAAQSNAQSFHLHSVIGNEHVNTMPHVQMSFERKSSPMEQGFHQQPQSPGQTAMNVHLSLVQQAANDPTIQTGKGGSHFTMSESVQSSSTNKGSVTPTASQPHTERRTATGFIKASNSVLPDAGTQSKQTAGHTTLPAVLKPVYLNQQVTSPPVATVAGNVNTHDLSILHQMVASSSSKTNNLDPTAITYQAPLGTPIEQTNGQAATNGALQPMSVSQSQPTSHGQHSVSQNTKEIGTLHPVLTRQSNSQHSAWASNTNNQDTGTQLSILNLKANGELTPVFVNQQNSHNNPNLNTNVFSHPSTTVVSSQWQELTSQLSSTGQQGLNTGTSQLSSTGQQGINTGTAGTTTGQIKSQVSHSGASPPQPDPAQALYETMFSSTQSHTNNVESHSTPTGGQVPNGPNPVLSKQSSNGLLIPISLNAQDTSNSNNIASTTEHVSSSSFSQSGQHQSHTLPAVSHSPASTSQHGSSGGQPQTMVHTQTVNRQNNNIGQPQTTGSLFPAFGEPSSNSFGQASSVGTEVNLGGPNNQEHHSLSSSTVNIILRPHSAIDQSTTANLHTNGGGHMATNVQEVQQVMNQNEINNQGLQTANHQVYQSSNNQIQQGGNTQGGMQTIDNPDIQTVNSNGHEIISSQGSQMQNQMVNSNSVQPTAVLNAIIAQNGNNHQTGNQVNNAQTMSSHLNNNQQINGQINQLNINQMSTEHAVNNQLNGNAMNNQQSVNNELNGNQMNTQQVVNNQKNNNEQLNTKQTVHIQFTSNQINSQQAANNQLDTQHTINNQLNSNQQSNTQHILDNQLNNNQMSSQQVVNNQLNSNQMSSQQDMNNQLNNNQMNIQQDMNNNQMNIQQDMNNQLNNNQMSSQQVVNNQLNSNQMSSQQAVDTQLNSNQINTQQAVNNPLNNNQIMNIQQQNNQRIIDSQQLNNNEQINSQQTVNNQQINGNQGVNDHRMVDSQSGRQISAVDAGSGVVTSTQRQTSHSGLINTEIGVQPPKIANTQFTRTQGQTGIRNSNIIGIKRPMDAIAKAKLTANIQRLLNAGFDPEDILEMYRMHRVELG